MGLRSFERNSSVGNALKMRYAASSRFVVVLVRHFFLEMLGVCLLKTASSYLG